ncbi:MAG TPA: SDR family oxidoreductase [Polyangiaceae bacterium]|jgi:UDP-N-acetylglucosamine 4-epimerase|nr:SDR family oxidoreductase [Polyangiaceae bacterium]
MTHYEEVQAELKAKPRTWLVTGVAGFIGSHLLEKLLILRQRVVGLDNFATGQRKNLTDVAARVGEEAFANFRFLEGDIRDPAACAAALRGVELVLHQAALASVPRSMADPASTHSANVDGFVNVLLAARSAGVQRVVYASSSSVYGDDTSDVKVETRTGRTLSPYATSKLVNEIYADTFRRTHGIDSAGLRYFNVFGPRQDPNGAYAAVIPRWTEQLVKGAPCVVFGDGSASRDFCFVDNVVQANLLAACTAEASGSVFNVAFGARTTLLELFSAIRERVALIRPAAAEAKLHFDPPRPGDIPHSLADIGRARDVLGYRPAFDLARGLDQTVPWYGRQARPSTVPAAAASVAVQEAP